MCRKIIFLFLATLLCANITAQYRFPLSVTSYDLDLTINYKENKLSGKAEMQITNTADTAIAQIPLLLYRLMRVNGITDATGRSLSYHQNVEQFTDMGRLQVNHICINEPVPPRSTQNIIINYDGYLLGYAETGMRYIKDEISPQFTMIRNDAYSYPVIGKPSFGFIVDNLPYEEFDYRLAVTVPHNQVVANGGILKSKNPAAGQMMTYLYESKMKNWRIDVAIAPYHNLKSERLDIYYFEDDSLAAQSIASYADKALAMYESWWGKLKDNHFITLIETARQSGGQTDKTTILLPSDGFNSEDDYEYLFHELSHLWNVRISEPGRLSPRFEEGLATFCQYLAAEKLIDGKAGSLKTTANRMLRYIGNEYRSKDILRQTPLIDFGNKGITGYSYSQGMLLFTILYYWLGEENFNKAIATFYDKYYHSGATTKDLVDCFKKVMRGKRIENFFNDWMYTTDYSRPILEGKDIDALVKYYKKSRR